MPKLATPQPVRPRRKLLPARLFSELQYSAACSPALSALRRTRLSPLEIWASPRFRIAWKLWAIRNYGNQRQQKQANNKYKAPSKSTSKFLQLFPKPPARLLALCKPPKKTAGSR